MSHQPETDNEMWNGPGKRWPQGGPDIPWFDREDALDILQQRVDAGRYDAAQEELLRHWVTEGYVVLPGAIDGDAVDGMLTDLEGIWTAEEPLDDLRIEELQLEPDGPEGVTHRQLLEVEETKRLHLRDHSVWRTHGFYRFSKHAETLFRNQSIQDLCSLIFDVPAEPKYTINFMYSSGQALHQDTAVFHIHPANYLIGLWLACEDISPDSGPLVYCPGSHRDPLYERFDNYPQTNLRTCSDQDLEDYTSWVEREADRFETKSFLAKKGDALLWHGMLIHGGSDVKQPGLTRKSYVCHYIAEGKDRNADIEGPFRW